jgi:hypothetical protein
MGERLLHPHDLGAAGAEGRVLVLAALQAHGPTRPGHQTGQQVRRWHG